jgi:flagellar biosynthesis component FlhA
MKGVTVQKHWKKMCNLQDFLEDFLVDGNYGFYKMSSKNYYPKSMQTLDTLILELGKKLIPLVERENDAPLLEEIHKMRHEIKSATGFDTPKIRIVDNLNLEQNECRFLIHDNICFDAILTPDENATTIAASMKKAIMKECGTQQARKIPL